ncbi:MAG TPA: hypothetical protein VNZ03_35915 [Terriglobales bacterium]|nr:hypothetical protein [Terriglobales bacterium]
MEGRTICAVPECGAPISGDGNLCDQHRIPGGIVRVGASTMVITAWAAEHGDECGIVLLNDFTLGARFNGAEGFLAKLQEQGLVNVHLLRTPEDLAAAKSQAEGKRVGAWSGSWHAEYPWQEGAQQKERSFSDLRALVLTNVARQDGNALMALVYADGTIRLKYPHGGAANIDLQGRVEGPVTLDEQIQMAEKSMWAYCSTVTQETPQFTVHRIPGGLDNEAARKWLESLPGVELVEHHKFPEELGGLLPSDGKAG